MSKKRTKKQKMGVNYSRLKLLYGQKNNISAAPVKRHFKTNYSKAETERKKEENANVLEKQGDLGRIKREIFKSLFFSSLILASEVVIYLAWN